MACLANPSHVAYTLYWDTLKEGLKLLKAGARAQLEEDYPTTLEEDREYLHALKGEGETTTR
jgi:hypothetical protein